MAERWTPDSWRASRSSRCRIIRTGSACRRGSQLAGFPPLVFAGEARNLKKALARVARRRGFPAAGRRLRRKLRRAWRRQYPRLLPRVPADGGGADLCRRLAGGEGRPHRRPVRQAALGRRRDQRRRRRCRAYRGDIINDIAFTRGGARARSAPPARGLSPVGGDAQPAARLRARRLRQSRERASLDARLRQGQPAVASATRNSPTASPRRSASCGPAASIRKAIRSCAPTDFYTSHEALLLGYEQALTRVEFDHRRLVRDLRPHAVDRRPHPPARSRPCRILRAASRIRSASNAGRRSSPTICCA